jgi:hypothetical protein
VVLAIGVANFLEAVAAILRSSLARSPSLGRVALGGAGADSEALGRVPVSRTSTIATGVAGIVCVVLLFGGQFIGAAGSTAEPGFDGSAQEIAGFFGSLRAGPLAAGTLIVLLGVVALLTFAAGLRDVLAPGGDSLPVLAVRAAQLCAVGFVAAVVSGGWEIGVLRRSDLDPQIARLIFDWGSLTFANSWVLIGGFAVGAGIALLAGRTLPAWLGWWAVVAGAGMMAARAVWLSEFWLLPYLLLWLWIVVVSVLLLVRARQAQPGASH